MKSQTTFSKACPVCGALHYFKNQYFLARAIKANTRCKKCCRVQSTIWQTRKTARVISHSCKYCNTSFSAKYYKNRVYCSTECRNKAVSIPNQSICGQCSVSFMWYGNLKKPRKFCSVTCANTWIFNNVKSSTEPERKVMEILDSLNIPYSTQYELEGKLYDFKLKDLNVLIEVDGVYWHGKNKLSSELNEVQSINRINDKLKNKIASRLGYKLIRVWEGDESSLAKKLDPFINKLKKAKL